MRKSFLFGLFLLHFVACGPLEEDIQAEADEKALAAREQRIALARLAQKAVADSKCGISAQALVTHIGLVGADDQDILNIVWEKYSKNITNQTGNITVDASCEGKDVSEEDTEIVINIDAKRQPYFSKICSENKQRGTVTYDVQLNPLAKAILESLVIPHVKNGIVPAYRRLLQIAEKVNQCCPGNQCEELAAKIRRDTVTKESDE